MPEFWIPKREILRRRIEEERQKATPPWQRALDWAFLPFTAIGMGARNVWQEMQNPEEHTFGTPSQWVPGGEKFEEFRELPMWQQFLWESPTFLLPGVGLGAKGLKGLASAGKAITGMGGVRAAGQVGKQAISKARVGMPVTPEVTETIGKVDPFIEKLKGAFNYALKTQGERAKALKGLRREQALGLEEAYAIPEGTESYYKALRGLKTALEKGDFKLPGELRFTADEAGELINRTIAAGKDKFTTFHAQRALMKFAGLVRDENGVLLAPIKSELDELVKFFPELESIINAYKTVGQKAWMNFVDAANLPRSMLASGDFSMTFRQGALLLARKPQFLPGTLETQLRVVFSPKNWKLIDDEIRSRPNIQLLLEKTNFYLAPEPGTVGKLIGMEETFMSKIAENIPFLGKFVRASERAFSGGLNYLRASFADDYVNFLRKTNILTDENLESAAHLINAASGRGSLPDALKGAAPLLNGMMFSPRLVISRFEFPSLMFSKNAFQRKEAIRTFVQFMGIGTAFLSMAKMAGGKVEINPRSSDFGKLKIGNTRLDIWAGYVQWARFIGQMSTAERKIVETGRIQPINRLETVWRMMQSKGSPIFGLMVDLLAGYNYMGEPMFEGGVETAKRELRGRLTPLFAQDLIDAIDADGLMGALVASPGALGVGVVSYKPEPGMSLSQRFAQKRQGRRTRARKALREALLRSRV